MQEGTAANQPIQKTEVKVSVVSRKRTNTFEHVLSSQQNAINQGNQVNSLSLIQVNSNSHKYPEADDPI